MNIFTKAIEAGREKKRKALLEKQQAAMEKLDSYMKETDEDAYRLAHLISEVVKGGKGYMLMATMLTEDSEGKDVLRHQAVISKGFKMEDVLPTCDEQTKLAENAIEQNNEYLRPRAGETKPSGSSSPSPSPAN